MLLNETHTCPDCNQTSASIPVWCEKCKKSYCSKCIHTHKHAKQPRHKRWNMSF